MTITLYELAGDDAALRFSPHCWKSHLALNHKQLAFDAVPVRYDEIKTTLAFADYSLLPVLRDGDHVVTDSWNIACYLEERYPEYSLFGDEAGKALAESIHQWCSTDLSTPTRPMIMMEIYHLIAEKDKRYFRESRESRLGKSLESLAEQAPEALQGFRSELDKVRELLSLRPYLSGEQPGYADICLLSHFIWIASVSDRQLLADDDHVMFRWYQHVLSHYPDARRAVTRG